MRFIIFGHKICNVTVFHDDGEYEFVVSSRGVKDLQCLVVRLNLSREQVLKYRIKVRFLVLENLRTNVISDGLRNH